MWSIRAFGAKLRRIHYPGLIRVDDGDIGGSTDRKAAAIAPEHCRRRQTHQSHEIEQRDLPRPHERQHHRKPKFEPAQAERGGFEGARLLIGDGVWCMIGSYDVERAIVDRFEQELGIGTRAQRWIDLGVGVGVNARPAGRFVDIDKAAVARDPLIGHQ